MTPMMEARAVKNADEQEAMRIVGAIGGRAALRVLAVPQARADREPGHGVGMKYLFDIPGMEDVEDIIVSSGPNAWPNWRNFSDRIIRPARSSSSTWPR
jgi:Xaa-Pro aminopeptidase